MRSSAPEIAWPEGSVTVTVTTLRVDAGEPDPPLPPPPLPPRGCSHRDCNGKGWYRLPLPCRSPVAEWQVLHVPVVLN